MNYFDVSAVGGRMSSSLEGGESGVVPFPTLVFD